MMLSEEAGGTPSSDLLVERAAAFDVLSIGIPTSTPVMSITYDTEPAQVPRQTSNCTTTLVIGYWKWLQVMRTLGMSLSEMSIQRVQITNNQFQ